MDEMMEFNNRNGQEKFRPVLTKWLKNLFILQCVSAVFSLSPMVSLSLVLSSIVQIVSLGLSVCLMVVLYRLSAVNGFYRKSAIAMIFQIVGSAGVFLMTNVNVSTVSTLITSVLSLVSSVGSLVAVYFQYQGHKGVTLAAGDEKLSGRWSSLFVWQIVVGVLVGVISAGVGMVMAFSGSGAESLVTVILSMVALPSLILQAIYLWYLYKTWNLYRETE